MQIHFKAYEIWIHSLFAVNIQHLLLFFFFLFLTKIFIFCKQLNDMEWNMVFYFAA